MDVLTLVLITVVVQLAIDIESRKRVDVLRFHERLVVVVVDVGQQNGRCRRWGITQTQARRLLIAIYGLVAQEIVGIEIERQVALIRVTDTGISACMFSSSVSAPLGEDVVERSDR